MHEIGWFRCLETDFLIGVAWVMFFVRWTYSGSSPITRCLRRRRLPVIRPPSIATTWSSSGESDASSRRDSLRSQWLGKKLFHGALRGCCVWLVATVYSFFFELSLELFRVSPISIDPKVGHRVWHGVLVQLTIRVLLKWPKWIGKL